MKFNDIIGNKEVKQKLINLINDNNLVHSYMFVGKQGIGKKMIAEEFTRMILCKNGSKIEDDCDSCIKYISSNHPDFIEINPDGDKIKISQIRELIDFVYKKPIVSNRKVIIINDADTMTQEAQNSLLKTLEEPPEYVVIILIISNTNLLLNTIKSRCVCVNFEDISKQDIKNYIQSNNMFNIENENLINLCNGSIGTIYEIADNIEQYNETETFINNVFKNINNSLIDSFKSSDILYKSKDNINNILDYIIILIYQIGNKENYSIETIQNIVYEIEETKRRLRYNANYDMNIDRLLFEIKKQLSNI